MKTSFMRPAVGPLQARGSVLRRTASFAFTEAKIYDAQERVCAHATGTFKYVKRRLPTGPGSANAMRPPSTD
jgi:acyl-coenzyme A thioesterase PaaI-like protein